MTIYGIVIPPSAPIRSEFTKQVQSYNYVKVQQCAQNFVPSGMSRNRARAVRGARYDKRYHSRRLRLSL